jgi:hypothetical protein
VTDNPYGTAEAVLTCHCGRSLTVPLMLGSGNALDIDIPDEWYLAYTNDGEPAVECPRHRSKGPDV